MSDSSTSHPGASSSSGTSSPDDGASTGAELPSQWFVTADFTAGTITLGSFDALVAGARTRAELVIATLDLSGHGPGPLEVEIAPDGRTALVSISPGFYDGIVGQNLGLGALQSAGALLAVDLDTQEIRGEIATAHVAMGMAFAPDGTRAYSANFGLPDAPGSTVSVIDLATLEVLEDVEVGEHPEQIAIDESGTLGIVNVDGLGGIRVFETADVAGTLSEAVATAGDPSGVAWVPGTSLAVVANSLGASNWAVVDAADPSLPVVREQSMAPGGIPYGATAIPGTTDVLVTLANDSAAIARIDAGADPSTLVWKQVADGTRTFSLGVAVDAASGLALSGAIGSDALLVVPLDGTGIEVIADWSTPGPCYVAIGAPRG